MTHLVLYVEHASQYCLSLILALFLHTYSRKMEEVKPEMPKLIKSFHTFSMECSMVGEALMIEVKANEDQKIFWTMLSQDTIPEAIKVLFPNPKSVYEFFEETTDSGEVSIPNIDKIVISIKVGKNKVEFPIYLTEKMISSEEKLKRRVSALEKEVEGLKKRLEENYEVINLQFALEEKQSEIEILKLRIEELAEENLRLQRQGEIQHNIKSSPPKQGASKIESDSKLKKEVQDLTTNAKMLQDENARLFYECVKLNEENRKLLEEAGKLNGIIESQSLILSQSHKEIKENQDLLQYFTGESRLDSDFGKMMVFKPLATSVNYNCYTFANKLLTKNNSSNNGAGRMIPDSTPIPKTGRYYYKFINRNTKEHPNFRIGVICRNNMEKETYMNGGDADAVMYYCYSSDKEIIYEGTTKLEGFNIAKGDILIVVIDREKKQVEWFINGKFMSLTKFTESMKKAELFYFFVQLWSNGDALEVVTA